MVYRIGVNYHGNYDDGLYADTDAGIAKLKWLGVDLVRDKAPNPTQRGQGNFARLAAAGIQYSLFCTLPPAEALAQIKSHLPREAVYQLEGPNEINNEWVTYDKLVDTHAADGSIITAPATTKYMADLRAAMSADRWFDGIPLAGVSSWPPVGTKCDLSNFHFYPGDPKNPGGDFAAGIAQLTALDKTSAVTVTEYNLAGGALSESDAGDMIWFLRDEVPKYPQVKSVFIYELLCAYSNQWSRGLFNFDGTPRPAAYALKALLASRAAPPAPGPTSPPAPAPAPAPAPHSPPAPAPAPPLSTKNLVTLDVGIGNVQHRVVDLRQDPKTKLWKTAQSKPVKGA